MNPSVLSNAPPLWNGPTVDGDQLDIRIAVPADLQALVAVETESWDPSQRADESTILRRLRSPRVVHILAYSYQQNRAVGYVAALKLRPHEFSPGFKWDHYSKLSQAPAPQNGGEDSLYIVNISAHPQAPRGTGTRLVQTLCRWAKAQSLSAVRYGIRLPHLSQMAQKGVTPEAYVLGLGQGEYHEDIYRLAMNSGGEPRCLMEDYYADSASLNFGLLVEHFVNLPEDRRP
jgi:hypothetical protein